MVSLETRVAILEERIAGRSNALALQAREYERRLTDLNHAHAQAEEKNREYLPRDTYEKSETSLLIWRRDVDAVLSALGSRREQNIAYLGTFLAVLSLVLWVADILWRRQ